MKEKKIYILLTDTGTLLTKIIRYYTKYPLNHASICFDPNLLEVYSFGRKNPKNPFFGGFVKEDIKSPIFNESECALYCFNVTDEEWNRTREYLKKFEESEYRYNFIGLFGFLINTPIKRKKAFFCSQFIATVLSECRLANFDKPIPLIAPYDLELIPELQLVYKGKLKDYIRGLKVARENRLDLPMPFIPVEM